MKNIKETVFGIFELIYQLIITWWVQLGSNDVPLPDDTAEINVTGPTVEDNAEIGDAREEAPEELTDPTTEISDTSEPQNEIIVAKFEPAYVVVFGHEGGFQKEPDDIGNYNSLGELVGTNWGISARVYERWIGRPPTEEDMRNMPKSTGRKIFKVKFWDRIKGDHIHDQQLATFFFDGAVNHGAYGGTKLMQEVLGVDDDGIVGAKTLTALNGGNPEKIFNAYKARRLAYYHHIVELDEAKENPIGKRNWLPIWKTRMRKFQYARLGKNGAMGKAVGAVILLLAGLAYANS